MEETERIKTYSLTRAMAAVIEWYILKELVFAGSEVDKLFLVRYERVTPTNLWCETGWRPVANTVGDASRGHLLRRLLMASDILWHFA